MVRRKLPLVTDPEDLTPREGKVLRYFVDRKRHGDNQTAAEDSIVEIPWSDLPHTVVQAVMTASSLAAKGLLLKVSDGHYTPTHDGVKLIGIANKAKMWQVAPPPSTTNNPVSIDVVLKVHMPKAKPPVKAKAKPKAKPKPKPEAKPKARGTIRIKRKKT